MLSVRIFHNYRIETNSAFGNSSRYNQHSNTSAFPATEMRFAFLAQVLLLLLDRPFRGDEPRRWWDERNRLSRCQSNNAAAKV